ncbi:MAG: DUF1294 domain-containing protein [Ruminococcaceae bacterium]|nr:DUF1294 domain-containing protein [Oscillospiraceae bacterium]
MKLIITYLLIINLITFLLFFIDKRKAIKKKWRIRESVLFGFSALGGSLGGFAAMQIFRHKTKTPIFKFGVPFIIILQIVISIYITKSL